MTRISYETMPTRARKKSRNSVSAEIKKVTMSVRSCKRNESSAFSIAVIESISKYYHAPSPLCSSAHKRLSAR